MQLIKIIRDIQYPQSMAKPKTTGDRALANTATACSNAFAVPILLTPYNSAQSYPMKGADKPKLNPNKDI